MMKVVWHIMMITFTSSAARGEREHWFEGPYISGRA